MMNPLSTVRRYFVGAGLAGILALAAWGARVESLRAGYKAEVAVLKARIAAESNAHNTTLGSLSNCRSSIDAQNDAIEARAAERVRTRKAYQKRAAALREQAAATNLKIERLKGIADHAAANPTCAAPQALIDALEGL